MVVAGILIVVLGLSVGTWHIQDHHDSARVDRGVRSYFLVLPAAAKFLLNFNDSQFNVQVQAKQYYSFFATTLLACGIVFQVPVGILSVTRLGIVKVEQLTKNRRYAYLVCAVVAAALPGVDPISMLLEMAPLVVLYEVSILLAKAFGTPAERVDAAGGQSARPRRPIWIMRGLAGVGGLLPLGDCLPETAVGPMVGYRWRPGGRRAQR